VERAIDPMSMHRDGLMQIDLYIPEGLLHLDFPLKRLAQQACGALNKIEQRGS